MMQDTIRRTARFHPSHYGAEHENDRNHLCRAYGGGRVA